MHVFYDKDMLNMFSYGPAKIWKQCRESFKNVFNNYSIEGVKWEPIECIVDHNFAFVTLFEQKWISNDKQDTISFKMRGMSVYKKQEDGSWKHVQTDWTAIKMISTIAFNHGVAQSFHGVTQYDYLVHPQSLCEVYTYLSETM